MGPRKPSYRRVRTPSGYRYQGPGGRWTSKAEYQGARRLAQSAIEVKKNSARIRRRGKQRKEIKGPYRPSPSKSTYYPKDPGAGYYKKLYITTWDFRGDDAQNKGMALLKEFLQLDANVPDEINCRLAVTFDDGKTAGNKVGSLKRSLIYLSDLLVKYKGEIIRVKVFIYTRSNFITILRSEGWKLKPGLRPSKAKDFKVSKPPKKEKELRSTLKPTVGILKRLRELGRSGPSVAVSSQRKVGKKGFSLTKRKKKTKR